MFQALAADGSYDGLESFVSKSLEDPDPQTGEAFTHDTWVELPTMWIRLHRLPRSTLFAPSEQLQGGPLLSDLSGVRVTITLDDYHGMLIQEDVWTVDGETSSACDMIRGATCFEKKDLVVHEMPEVADPDLYESSARRPKGLPAPGEPTLTERREHELTHLPFRSWCPTCVRAKSKQNHSRTLKTKQPVIQLDYAFLGDNSENPQVTLVTAIDLLSGLGLSRVVPSKGRSVYAQAELRRFVLETGRTFGILQIDPEPSLKALVAEITSEVGGLSVRHSPSGWKQAQGAVGTLQSNLYAQIRALKLDRMKNLLAVGAGPGCTLQAAGQAASTSLCLGTFLGVFGNVLVVHCSGNRCAESIQSLIRVVHHESLCIGSFELSGELPPWPTSHRSSALLFPFCTLPLSPSLSRRMGPFAGVRIGEASHPSPAAKANKRRIRRNPAKGPPPLAPLPLPRLRVLRLRMGCPHLLLFAPLSLWRILQRSLQLLLSLLRPLLRHGRG